LQANSTRIKTVRGNVNYEESLDLKGIKPDKYYYKIQSIDNALSVRAEPDSGGGTIDCSPGVACGTFETCETLELTYEHIEVCANTPFVLSSNEVTSVWYSYSDGLLSFKRTLVHQVDAQDTLISNTTTNPCCNTMKAYVIIPLDKNMVNIEDITICEPADIIIDSPIQADSVKWLTIKHALISNQINLNFKAERTDTLIYNAYKGYCFISDTFHIRYCASNN
jgi:hypothetical protein